MRHLSHLRPGLARTYVGIAIPGGSAVERVVRAAPGMSHLFEHLWYRENDAAGFPLDALGGRVGFVTTAEATYATLSFASSEARRARELLLSWWEAPRLEENVVASERRVVADEVAHAAKSPARYAWRELVTMLVPGSHLAGDLGGEHAHIERVSKAEVESFHGAVRALGGASVWVGSDADDEISTNHEPPPFVPERIAPVQGHVRRERRSASTSHAVVGALTLFPGRSSRAWSTAVAKYGTLAYGRIHRAQQTFHRDLGLRHLDLRFRAYHEHTLVGAVARCEPTDALRVEEVLRDLLTSAGDEAVPDRVARCARHYLAALADQPEALAAEESLRLLHGASSLAEVLETQPTGDALLASLQEERPVATLVLRP